MSNLVGGVSAAVSKTAAAPIERVKLLIQNQVTKEPLLYYLSFRSWPSCGICLSVPL